MKTKLIYYGIALTLILVIACNPFGFEIWHEGEIPPAPIETPDTCASYAPATSPSFIQGYAEFDNPISAAGWVIHVGPYTDTLFPGQEDQFEFKLNLLINAYKPLYETESFTRPDALRLSIFTKGTDNANELNFKVWIMIDGAKWVPSFSRRAFYNASAVTKDEWFYLAEKYPTMTGFNLREQGLDSLGEKEEMIAVLDSCKLCAGCRADFRFNNFVPSDSISQAFDAAGWNTILPMANNGITLNSDGEISIRDIVVGTVILNKTIDTRGYNVSESQIKELLGAGYPVVTNIDL